MNINATSGPSGSYGTAAVPGLNRAAESPTPDDQAQRTGGKRGAKRSNKACRSCRVKKRKCGGTAPEPCPNCIAAEEECSWSVEDGRSSAVKRSRARMAQAIGSIDVTSQGIQPHDTVSDFEHGDWLSFMNDIGYVTPNDMDKTTGFIPHASLMDFGEPFRYAADLQDSDDSAHLPTAYTTSSLQAPCSSTMQMPSTENLATGWPSDVNTFELMMALASRMPQVEQSNLQEDLSPTSDTNVSARLVDTNNTTVATRQSSSERSKQFVKVTWWRPHGQTAIAPGLKRMTLKVRISDETASERALARSPAGTTSGAPPIELFIPGTRLPSVQIMKHLGPLFNEFFAGQLPFLDVNRCIADLESGNGSAFLLNCIASTAARFSSHPSIALSHLKTHEYGNVFFETAKEMLGSMLAVPVRDTIIALLLLCHVGFANDSEAEEWMFAGMAVRLAIDLGLHLHVDDETGIADEDKRLNQLVFWAVVLLDFALAFGTGRQPTFRVAEISQPLPADEDLPVTPHSPRHPYPYACRMMFSYGRLIELLNSTEPDVDGSKQRNIQKCKLKAVREYAHLPPDIRWDVQNLQRHNQAGFAPIYLQLHLWMHTIIASGHLTATDYIRRSVPQTTAKTTNRTGAITPNGAAWRSSARTIGDILVLSDIVCPRATLGLPFCNQAFFVAASCFVKELEHEREGRPATVTDSGASLLSRRSSFTSEETGEGDEESDSDGTISLFYSLLATVSTENIGKLRRGLERQTIYWSGVGWVAEALEQRIRGIAVSEIDLASIEKLATIASLPDAGLSGPGGQRYEGLGVEEAARTLL